ncbi:MAG: acetyl-CoA carboxylase biotin carboxylase subunit [Deltaproteobacteria bacterium]|nr:MAG: acetyl-CoA carboxylase biotin carboxylase subunit [Deltaproteobacteria bacterium]
MKKILVANRGEIAIRICRAIHEEGLKAVAIYETPDQESRHIREADESIWIGDGPRKDYLDIDKVIWAAKKTESQAIHPGYGFLAENPNLAKACEEEGIIFIGPHYKAVKELGDKTVSRAIAEKAGIPVVPGSGILPSEDPMGVALEFVRKNGFPVMLKAVAGGGGRGIRKINNEQELREQLPMAEKEALSAFGDGRLYIEKGIKRPRHVEVQVLADNHGNIVHLGTRDCSIQRRHQKLVEIAPSMLKPEIEKKICEAAVKFAAISEYRNAGTVEFLVDEENNFYFMEINTRLQVEHTVTELITGIDIVRRQIRIADGIPLDIKQEDIICKGFGIEVRINAEDPKRDFAPESGKIVSVYQSPGGPGIRLDGIAYQGYKIPMEYDSLLVKLSIYGFDWKETTSRLARALKAFVVVGPKTTIPFYLRLVEEEEFLAGRFDTEYIDRHPELFDYKPLEREEAKIARLIAEIHHKKYNPFAM